MEIRDVKTTCAKGDLCTPLGNQHFYVGEIYVRETIQAIIDCFIHSGTHKLVCCSPNQLRFWGCDSEVTIRGREIFPMAYTENENFVS